MNASIGAGNHDGPLHDPAGGCSVSVGEAATGRWTIVFLQRDKGKASGLVASPQSTLRCLPFVPWEAIA